MRAPLQWTTSGVVAALAVVAVLFLAWTVNERSEDRRRADERINQRIDLEVTWRSSVHGKLVELLTLIEHADCRDIEQLQQRVAEIHAELQELERERTK